MPEVKMPKFGESVTEGTISRWLKQVGDSVAKYEPLAEVVTDKVNAEIPSDFVGVLREILVGNDETVKVGTPIAIIEVTGEAPAQVEATGASASETTAVSAQVASRASHVAQVSAAQVVPKNSAHTHDTTSGGRYSPVVLRLAKERGIDLLSVHGTGLGGRVTRKDVLAWQPSSAVSGSGGDAAVSSSKRIQTDAVGAKTSVDEPAKDKTGEPEGASMIGVERIPVSAIRKTIARRMVESKREAPHAWMMMEVDATSLVRLREKQKVAFKAKEGVDLTFLPFFIKATVEALKEFPMVNSQWAQDQILVHRDVHISVAVATPDALAVPVIHHADRLSILGLAKALQDVATRAREGRLTLADVQGGTFTVNNTGAFGSILSQPIINTPQAAILSVESIVKRPIVQADDSIAIRSMVNLCMSLDHRVLDGWIAGQFMRAVKRKVESFSADTALY